MQADHLLLMMTALHKDDRRSDRIMLLSFVGLSVMWKTALHPSQARRPLRRSTISAVRSSKATTAVSERLSLEESLRRLRLDDRTGKSLGDKATAMEQTVAALAHHVPHGGVGHKFAMTHEIQRFLHRGRLIAIEAFTHGTKDVAGRKTASAQAIGQILGLRAFS
jgi:hypothetical protein